MKLLQRITLILFIISALLFAGSRAYHHFLVDDTPPVLTMDSDTVEMGLGDTRDALLRGVRATDNRDGDLTKEIIVQGVTKLIGENTAKVTYIVFDKANNMATCTRTVRYTDYEKPHFSMNQAAVYPVNGPVMLLDRLHASDVVDGDISGNIRIVSQNVNAREPGLYSVTAQVSNSLGDLDTVTLKVVVTDNEEPCALTLQDYIVYLDAGDSFEPTAYITAPEPYLVTVSHEVNTKLPGMYHVSYTCGADTVWQTVVVH